MPSNDNYIIAFDERGKPYIAHSIFSNLRNRFLQNRSNNGRSQQRSPRQNHKYILRIDDNGRKRYFYTREEILAYYKAKQGRSASDTDKNQNGKSLQETAKDAVALAKTQTARMYEDYRKLAENNKASQSSSDSTTSSASNSSKPYTGVADYARQKAVEANQPKKAVSSQSEEESEEEEKQTKKKSSSSSSSGTSSSRGSSGRVTAQQPTQQATQMPNDMHQRLMSAQQSARSDDSNEETEDTIAKAAKSLEGADKYDAYKKALEDYKANPSKENSEKKDRLRQEWLATPHGKFVTSVSSELKNKHNARLPSEQLNGLFSKATSDAKGTVAVNPTRNIVFNRR